MPAETISVPSVPFRTLVLFSTTDSDPRLTIDPLSEREDATTSPDPSNFVRALLVALPLTVASSVPMLLLK
jgi:hypothetical protein